MPCVPVQQSLKRLRQTIRWERSHIGTRLPKRLHEHVYRDGLIPEFFKKCFKKKCNACIRPVRKSCKPTGCEIWIYLWKICVKKNLKDEMKEQLLYKLLNRTRFALYSPVRGRNPFQGLKWFPRSRRVEGHPAHLKAEGCGTLNRFPRLLFNNDILRAFCWKKNNNFWAEQLLIIVGRLCVWIPTMPRGHSWPGVRQSRIIPALWVGGMEAVSSLPYWL